MIDRLSTLMEREDEIAVTLVKDLKGDYSVAIHAGREAADSPMVGAAAYGSGGTVQDALNEALTDFNI